tara:strand:+ start:208 stop:372 length:165 start_codon:yes stop_codon:yes gene_type:complete
MIYQVELSGLTISSARILISLNWIPTDILFTIVTNVSLKKISLIEKPKRITIKS